MTRSELLFRVAAVYPYINIRNIDRIISIVFEEIIYTLSQGGRVELRGFGTFCIRQRDEGIGRNPRTGEKVKIASKKVPFFKAGKQLKDYINNEEEFVSTEVLE